jgi:hypothetical protein
MKKKVSGLVGMMKAQLGHLLLDFEISYSSDQVSHPGERGRLLEETLKSFLVSYLPKRVGIGTGQIIGAIDPEPSRQIDIVLYDAINFPLLLNESAYQLFPNEAVLAVIEVKSAILHPDLAKGVEVIRSAKSLHKFPPDVHPKTLGILFGYRGRKSKVLIEDLKTCEYKPDLICSLKPSYLIVSTSSLAGQLSSLATLIAGVNSVSTFPQGKYVLIESLHYSKDNILLLFYLLLVNYINTSLNIGVDMGQYKRGTTAWTHTIIDI